MTPERVKAIVASIPDIMFDKSLPDMSFNDAIERAFRQAVNEALSEAIKPAMSEAIFWSDCNDTRAYKACLLIIGAIDALKLPEEP